MMLPSTLREREHIQVRSTPLPSPLSPRPTDCCYFWDLNCRDFEGKSRAGGAEDEEEEEDAVYGFPPPSLLSTTHGPALIPARIGFYCLFSPPPLPSRHRKLRRVSAAFSETSSSTESNDVSSARESSQRRGSVLSRSRFSGESAAPNTQQQTPRAGGKRSFIVTFLNLPPSLLPPSTRSW